MNVALLPKADHFSERISISRILNDRVSCFVQVEFIITCMDFKPVTPFFELSQNRKEQLILKCFLMVFCHNESTTEKYRQISRYLYNFNNYTLIRVLPLKMFGEKY